MALTNYARQVRRSVLETLPRLAPYLSDGPEGSLSISGPHPRIPTGLVIDTAGDEITIGFHEWHTHGDMLGGDSPEEHVSAALEFVLRVLEDEVQLVVRAPSNAPLAGA